MTRCALSADCRVQCTLADSASRESVAPPGEPDCSGHFPFQCLASINEPHHQLQSALIVFAGRDTPTSLASAFRSRGTRVKTVDIKIGGNDHNVLSQEVLDDLLLQISRNEFQLVWIATPCASFSVFWLDPNRTTLRDRGSPAGCSALPKRWRNYVAKHNRLAEVSASLARATFSSGATFIIENPVDRGDRNSNLFEARFDRHAPLWLMPCLQSLGVDTSAISVSFPQCFFHGLYQKWTTLLIAGPLAQQFACLSRARCTHSNHERTRFGVDESGRSKSEASGEYPPLFNLCIAMLSDTPPTPWSAVTTLVSKYKLVSPLLTAAASAAHMPSLMLLSSPHLPSTSRSYCEWRSTPAIMPTSWPEYVKFPELIMGDARCSAIRYVSRRRAEPESPQELFSRPLPHTFSNPRKPAITEGNPTSVAIPSGAPPRPIHISQLYLPGVYDSIRQCIFSLSSPIQSALLSSNSSNDPSFLIPSGVTTVFKQHECQPEWARGVIWDTSDPFDCKPMQAFDLQNDHPGPNAAFFKEWSQLLNWQDKDMIRQMTITGAESRSQMVWDTVIHAHHTGIRRFIFKANEAVSKDTQAGWIEHGRHDLWTVPARLTPRNVVRQLKWKLDQQGNLVSKEKWRLTSDDSIAAPGSDSRNACIDPSEWDDVSLPSILSLAEAIAIVKSHLSKEGISFPKHQLQRVALWALDLTDAYRMLKVSRHELWMQGFVWADGVRLDRRALFGSAHLVGLFQRVSSFLLAVAKRRISEFDRHHPYDLTRTRWLQSRKGAGLEPVCSFADIYIDDSFGLTCLSPDEPLFGSGHGCMHVDMLLTVRLGGHVRVMLRHNLSRVQMHTEIVSDSFNEAGWGTASEKKQIGFDVNLLGFSISSLGDGYIYVPEAKRQGMIKDIDEQLQPESLDGAVPREKVETLVGRASHLAMVASEGNAFLKPLFAMVNARRRGIYKSARRNGTWSFCKLLVKPRFLHIKGRTKAQQAYQLCLRWWRAAFASGISVPLAYRRSFPLPGEPGCACLFSDAAREYGTGFGGFSMLSIMHQDKSIHKLMLYMSELWTPFVLQKLQSDDMSMAAGEAFGVIALMDALAEVLVGLTHLVVFSDSSASVQLINSGNSGSSQMDYLMRWFIQRRPSLHVLAIYIPGVCNSTSDALSRNKGDRFLAEASSVGCSLQRLRPAHECCSMVSEVILQDQRVKGLLRRLHAKAASALDAAFAPRSRGPLTSAIRALARFAQACPQRELFHEPRTIGDCQASAWNEWTFVLFATYLNTIPSKKTKRPVSVKTIESYISLLKGYLGFSYAFELMDRAPRLKRYLAALKEIDPSRSVRKKRRALRRRHLRAMWKRLPKVRSSSVKAVNQFALLATAWHVLARGGELAPASFDPQLSATRADLQFRSTAKDIRYAVVWLIPLKKKGPASRNKVPQIIQQHDGKGSDVYAALERLVRYDPVPEEAKATTPLFRDVTRSGQRKHFTTLSMRTLIRSRMRDLGYAKPNQWGAQSCRIGGATDLASTGRASQLLLQAKGRWSSDIGKIYARMTRRCQLAASRLMQRASGRDIEELMPDFTQPA